MASTEKQNFKAENVLTALSQIGIKGEALCLDGEFRGGQCHIFKLQA